MKYTNRTIGIAVVFWAMLLVLNVAPASAQVLYYSGGYGNYGAGYGGYGGNGAYGGYGYGNQYNPWGWQGGYGGTAAGSYYHGMADVVRSQGQYNLLTSEAAKNLEDAKKKEIENRKEWTDTYLSMRRTNAEYQKSVREANKKAPEDWVRYAKEAAPDRLSSNDLDVANGEVNWPTILMQDAFRQDREQIDQLFRDRAVRDGHIGGDAYVAIQDAIKRMEGDLQLRIKAYPPNDYVKARSFLKSLAYEARFTDA